MAVSFPEVGDWLAQRFTGDLAVDDAGTRLAVPTFFVANESSTNGYRGEDPGESLVMPAVGLAELDTAGRPSDTRLVVTVVPEGITEFGREQAGLGSYLSGVAFSATGGTIAATMEGSDVVVAFQAGALESGGVGRTETTSHARAIPAAAFWVGGGPRGIVRGGDGAFLIHDFLDRQIESLDAGVVADALAESMATGTTPLRAEMAESAGGLMSQIPEGDVEEGRRLFFSAVDARMASGGSGISCARCHCQGRNDGLSWRIEGGIRQTKSLAGGIAETAPFTWDGTMPSAGYEARATVVQRMGGRDFDPEDLAAIEAWVATIRRPVASTRLDPDAIVRGAERFSTFACDTCHLPETWTDGLVHWMNGGYFDTATLWSVGLTAPYLHDGSAATLHDVLTLAAEGGMGDPFEASAEDLTDLEAFLSSL